MIRQVSFIGPQYFSPLESHKYIFITNMSNYFQIDDNHFT